MRRVTFWTCLLVAVVFLGIVAVVAAVRGDRELLHDVAAAVEWGAPGALVAAVVLAVFGLLD